jgi:hypothetical protein
MFSTYGEGINFWHRTLNTLSQIYIKMGTILYVIPHHHASLQKYFNSKNISSISVLEKSTALLLIKHISVRGIPEFSGPTL